MSKEKINSENRPDEEAKKPQHKGAILKAARIEQGLSLESLHESTKIPMDALRAIEEDYTIRILSNFYYKSFLKIYAKALNVDVNKVVEIDRPRVVPPVIDKSYEEFQFDLKEFLSKILSRKRKQQIVILIGIFISFFLLFKVISFFMTKKPVDSRQAKVVKQAARKKDVKAVVPVKSQPRKELKKKTVARKVKPQNEDKKKVIVSQKQVIKVEPKKVVKPEQAPKTAASVTTVAVSSKAQQQTQAGKNVVLTVRATKASWLRIAVDGEVVFQSTLRLGAVETWMADEKIEISGKYIGQLEFELNGKMLGSLGRGKRRIKNVVVTKEGLSVNK